MREVKLRIRKKELEILSEVQAWIPLLSEWKHEKHGELTITKIGTIDSYDCCVIVGFSLASLQLYPNAWLFHYSDYKEKLVKFTSEFQRLERGI